MDLKRLKERARMMMDKYGLKDWALEFDNSLSHFGLCSYDRRTIFISNYAVSHATDFDLLDTIMHEIAHALTPGEGHSRVWKKKCKEIGAIPKMCSKEKNYVAPGRWQAVCGNCGKFYSRHRRPDGRWWCRCLKEHTTNLLDYKDINTIPEAAEGFRRDYITPSRKSTKRKPKLFEVLEPVWSGKRIRTYDCTGKMVRIQNRVTWRQVEAELIRLKVMKRFTLDTLDFVVEIPGKHYIVFRNGKVWVELVSRNEA